MDVGTLEGISYDGKTSINLNTTLTTSHGLKGNDQLNLNYKSCFNGDEGAFDAQVYKFPYSTDGYTLKGTVEDLTVDTKTYHARNYQITITKGQASIGAKDISTLSITLDTNTYTAHSQNANIKVMDGSYELDLGTDYVFTEESAKTDAGTGYSYEILGTGNYSGSKTGN